MKLKGVNDVTMRMISAKQLCILLDQEDLLELSLSAEEFNQENKQCRQVLHQLLEVAKSELGFRSGGKRMLVEVYPWMEGGCALYFSPSPEQFADPEHGPGRSLYSFCSLEDLLRGMAALFPLYCHKVFQSSLYRMENRWWLTMTVFDQQDESIPACLTEFGRMESRLGADVLLEEHGHPIIVGNAVDKLAYYLITPREE